MRIVVERSEDGSAELARLLAGEGHDVRTATQDDLDADPGPADTAYLDVWTPESAPRVQRLRAQGTRLTCLGDLLLERWPGPTVGVTGTAGKTTTTSLVASILREARVDVAVSKGARAGNLWPTADLLGRLAEAKASAEPPALLLELTSSHLAFMHRSPRIAAVISFWPDHVELHGSLQAYRAAKERIVRHQRPGDLVVVNADDGSGGFAGITPADRAAFSLTGPVERGAYLDEERGVVVRGAGGEETAIGSIHATAAHPAAVIAACAIASVAGAPAGTLAAGVAAAPRLAWRGEITAIRDVGVADDGMAATPTKGAATLARFGDRSVVLVAGGLVGLESGPVHASPPERELLEHACEEIARACRVVVLFGPAGTILEPLLAARGVAAHVTATLDDAVAAAVSAIRRGRDDSATLVFSPLYPVPIGDRQRFARLVERAAS